MNRKQQKGFSLIEIIIVISIIGIMMVIAIPSMSTVMEANQATEQSHNFISAIALGVSEAEKNNTVTTICAKKELTDTCVNYTTNPSNSTWQHGWLLFSDNNNSGTYDANNDDLIKIQINGTNKIKIDAAASAVSISSGGVITRGKGDYYFTPSVCIKNGHKVTVYNTGQVSVVGGKCP